MPNVNTGAAYSLINPGVDAVTNALATNTAALASPVKTFIALFYVYGSDIFTTRTPYRTGHLMNANSYVNQSLVVIGGAYPPSDAQPYGAMFVFNENANASVVASFVANDPYVQNNLVVRCGSCSRAGEHALRLRPRDVLLTARHAGPPCPPHAPAATTCATGPCPSSRPPWMWPPSPCTRRRRRRRRRTRPARRR